LDGGRRLALRALCLIRLTSCRARSRGHTLGFCFGLNLPRTRRSRRHVSFQAFRSISHLDALNVRRDTAQSQASDSFLSR
jgi:hypothetical protein